MIISYEEALSAILGRVAPLPGERVKLEDSLGYALAQDYIANDDSPPFDQSAVDGFGVRVADTRKATEESPVRLHLSGTILAGDKKKLTIQHGSTIKIMTGARVPQKIEAVVMKEFCEEEGKFVLFNREASPGENIRKQGEEFHRGQQVLAGGSRIDVPVVGLLATFGYAEVAIHRQPSVTVIVTGDELVAPGEQRTGGEIYDSNSCALKAACTELGIKDYHSFRVRDDRTTLKEHLSRALADSDVVITVGGVSVGDHDLVRDVLIELGVRQLFWKVAIKPGKPVFAGIKEIQSEKNGPGHAASMVKPVFGLPGNPVAALLCFQKLVKPALLKMMGVSSIGQLVVPATLSTGLIKKAGRLAWVRGVLSYKNGSLSVRPATGQESHMLGGLASANCLIEFPASQTILCEGEQVKVELINWLG